MCVVVVINRGEKEIETPAQFKEHFGFEAEKAEHYKTVDPDCCLCQCDLEATFNKHSIEFKTDAGDYYIGLLDQVKGDGD